MEPFDRDALPPLREVIEANDLWAQKKLGQNFLLDQNITDKIVKYAGDLSQKTVFEIGPGPGGLTRSLLAAGAKKVIAVEYDPRAVAALQPLVDFAGGRLEVLQADAMDTDLTALCPNGDRAIVANLPYNIATPLLIGWLGQLREDFSAYDVMVLMFQKEVAERVTAQAGDKPYGRLGVVSGWLCDAKKVFDLPPSAFTPPPKVTSSVVRFLPKPLESSAPSFAAMEKVTAKAFGQRRKMLRSSLKDHMEALEKCGIDPTLRAENLSIEDFTAIAAEL